MSEAAARPDGDDGLQARLALAPALGYFGGAKLDGLKIKVGMEVAAIELRVQQERATYLNLKGIDFVGPEGRIEIDPRACTIEQSSVQEGHAAREGAALLARKGIHSAKETNPWWRIAFDAPLALAAIRLWNRPDGWGRRTRTLQVRAILPDGSARDLYSGTSARTLASALSVLKRVAGIKLDPTRLDATAARLVRTGIIAELAGIARDPSVRVSPRDWRELMAFTGIWSADEPSADEWSVMAAYLLAQKQQQPGFATSMKTMSLLLDSRERLQRLGAELDVMADARGIGPFMLTRHGIRSEGILRRRSGDYLAHLGAVVRAMEGFGYRAVLAYGTLLGAVREGRFLAHDDDVDLVFIARAGTRAQVEREVVEVRDKLRATGFRAEDLLPKHLNMHVGGNGAGVMVDLFPCWLQDGRMWMHMKGMAIQGIDPEIMQPPGTARIEGATFPAPAKPEAFLRERYGDGWKVADPYYDWPWKLAD
jgi:hypothetical protein